MWSSSNQKCLFEQALLFILSAKLQPALFAACLFMEAGKPRLPWVLCSSHVEPLPQSQRVDPTFRGHRSPVAFKTKVHPAGALPLNCCTRGIAGDAIIPQGQWDGTHVLLSSPPPSPLCCTGASCPAWPPASAAEGHRPLTGLRFFSACPGMSHKASATHI